MMNSNLPEHLIYSITTTGCTNDHPGNDEPLTSFVVTRNGIPEVMNAWRGTRFTISSDEFGKSIKYEPLMVITKEEFDIMMSMLEYTDEQGSVVERTLPSEITDIVALIESFRAEEAGS